VTERAQETTLATPAKGIWIADRGGVEIGTVLRQEARYVVTTTNGRRLGDFSALNAALEALERKQDGRDLRRAIAVTAIILGMLLAVGCVFAIAFLLR